MGDIHDLFNVDLSAMAARVDDMDSWRDQADHNFGILGEIRVSLSLLTRELRESRKEREKLRQERAKALPIDADFNTTQLFPSAAGGATPTTLIIDCGGPSQGRIWTLRRLAVGGLTWLTPAAGTAEVYAGAPAGYTPLSPIPMSQIQDQAVVLPRIGFYERHQVVIQPPEHLFIAIQNGTAGQFYTVQGTAEDYLQDYFQAVMA